MIRHVHGDRVAPPLPEPGRLGPLGLALALAACATLSGPTPSPVPPADDRVTAGSGAAPAARASLAAAYEIVQVVPRDAVPAIDRPEFWPADEADGAYDADDLVIGVSVGDEHRAYSVPFLSGHEIVNDTIGGRPIAVTW